MIHVAWLTAGATFASLVLLAASQRGAESQEVSPGLLDRLLRCYGIEEMESRVDCYDQAVKPLAGLDSDQTQGGEAAQEVLFRFVGSDDADTDSFQVDQDWRVVWETGGRLLTIELRSTEGAYLDTIGNQIGSGLGRSGIQAPGTYTLALRGIGDWQVRIISAKSSAKSED